MEGEAPQQPHATNGHPKKTKKSQQNGASEFGKAAQGAVAVGKGKQKKMEKKALADKKLKGKKAVKDK